MVIAALVGLTIAAIANGAWSWLASVVAIAVVVWLSSSARLTARVQLILVASLAGGLGAEVLQTLLFAFSDTPNAGSMYRQVLIASLGSAIMVLAAMVTEYLLARLLSRGH